MSCNDRVMDRTITITSSPYQEDYQNGNAPPWIYAEMGFINWVDEIFLEGYKQSDDDFPFPTLDEAIEHIIAMGYTAKVMK